MPIILVLLGTNDHASLKWKILVKNQVIKPVKRKDKVRPEREYELIEFRKCF